MPDPADLPAIVVVDDNEEDIFFLARLLKKAGPKYTLQTIFDGEAAVKHFGRVASGQMDRPLACFLDIKMPGYDGFTVLDAIRNAQELDPMPTIMLSSSDDRRDVVRAAQLGAQGYLVKHPSAEAISAVLAQVTVFYTSRSAERAPLLLHRSNLLPI